MKIGIIGTGAYAIALASLFNHNSKNIIMWTKIESEYIDLVNNHNNKQILDYELPNNIKYTMDIKEALMDKDLIVLAVPVTFIRNTIMDIKEYITNQPILIATKGIDPNTNEFINKILESNLNNPKIACISGPSFAKDIIKKESIGLTIASNDQDTLKLISNSLSNISYLEIELISDIIGTEICGSIKNVMAIISGILEGIGVNSSTKAKWLVDASKNIKILIEALGGNINTFNTYAGLGDLILTCTSYDSRNFTYGRLIGENKTTNEIEDYKNKTTIEGLVTLESIYKIIHDKKINMPIIDLLYKIVNYQTGKEEILTYLKNSN